LTNATAAASWIGVAALSVTLAGCRSVESNIEQRRDKIESLAASTRMIVEGWLTGSTSRAYTMTALEQMLRLADEERHALASPEMLVRADGAALSKTAEQLSRAIAMFSESVRTAQDASVREQLARLPSPRPGDGARR
jgi:hypothetical protein